MLLTDDTLAAARATLEQLHVTEATHSQLVETVGADRSVTSSWTAVGTIHCRVETDIGDQEQGRIMGTAPADRPVYQYTVFTSHDTAVRSGDRLTLASGIVLSVMQDSRGQSQGFVAVLKCTEVTP